MGFLPSNYLKPKDSKKVATAPSAAPAPAPAPAASARPDADYNNKDSSNHAKRVRAVYPYSAQRIDELTVNENDVVRARCDFDLCARVVFVDA
jgi:hypothetical protein